VVVTDVDPLVGATIGGHYEIEALIGVGAMGRVYRAHHTRLVNKRYALKVLFGELTASPTMRMRFAHEAESASKLDHPNIVGVLDFGCTESGLMYLVMDIVEGPTLGAMIDQGAMSPSRVVALAHQLCAGLAHAHARGIIHRDFKPDNILVSVSSGTETLRIADFGLAISISDDNDGDARLTGTGVLCTPTYAAPEQLLGKEIDARADLYALGVTLYEMLTGGVLPFARGSQEVMLWKVTTEWPVVSARAPSVSPALAELIRGLLAREPGDRPASAQEVIDVLGKMAAMPERLAAPVPGRRRMPRTRTAMVAGAIALGGSVGLFARNDGVEATRTEAATLVATATSEEPIHTHAAPSVTREPAVPGLSSGEDAPAPPRRRLVAQKPGSAPDSIPPEPAPPIGHIVPPPPSIQAMRVPEPPLTVTRPPRIVGIEISGALAPSVVRRALERVFPALQACTDKVGARVVAVRFGIEETRRAVNVQLSGAGADSVAATLASMRTDTAPDIGEVSVMVRLSFGGT
jgi:serine/threonine-protein kinase